MIKNNKAIILAALLIALTTTILGVSANGKEGFRRGNKADWEAKHAQMEETRTKMDAAIESGNFETFKQVASEMPMGEKLLEKVTADNFSRFAEAHGYQKQAMGLMQKSGDIMKELGFEDFHKGHGRKFMKSGQPQAPEFQQ